MKDKVVIITGSGGGIGKATAIAFCKRGAKVMLNGRNAEKLAKTEELLRGMGFTVAAHAADITNFEDCKILVQKTLDTFGRLDVLVTNASLSMRARFDEMSPEAFKTVLDSNLYGSIMPIYAALDAITASKGSIVLIGSVAGFYGLPSASAYSTGKTALTAFSQSLRAELTPKGVHVGIVYVGFTENDDDKRVLDAQGNLVPVAARSRLIQQTQEQVAQSIVNLTARRRNRVVLSAIGKSLAFIVRFFPSVVHYGIQWSQRKFKDMYSEKNTEGGVEP
ncbi:MAG: SDR family oxidoreductase [Saprospiraceae bacterium]|nr:SDR family oxidoreductase [Saprospiraceae bacterium]